VLHGRAVNQRAAAAHGLHMVAGLQFMHDAGSALHQSALQQFQFIQFLYGKGQPAADVGIHGGFGGGIHRAVQ
jgi:hypothetical protein